MKNNYTITSDINLDVYPETLFLCEDNQSITIGDLHGNTLKLIYFLIQQGILILKNREQDYEQLVKLYKEFPDFTDSKDLCFLKKMDIKNIILDLEKLQQNKEQYLSLFSVNKCEVNTELSTNIQTIEDELKTLEEKRQVLQKEIEILTEQRKKRAKEILLKFEEILNNSSFIQPTKTSNRLIRFIGDMVGDRGKSDYFTLLMLNKLCENGVNYEIIMGNHELYFYSMLHEIHVYDDANDYVIPYPTQQITSTVSGLISLLNENIINKETVKQLVECCFISKLKLLSYDVSRSTCYNDSQLLAITVTIYSHAPIGMETIKALASKFNISSLFIDPIDSKVEHLILIIDNINNKFKQLLEQSSLLISIQQEREIVNMRLKFDPLNLNGSVPVDSPIIRCICNKNVGMLGPGGDLFIKRDSQNCTKSFYIIYVHGHIGEDIPKADSIKIAREFQEEYQSGVGFDVVDTVKHQEEYQEIVDNFDDVEHQDVKEPQGIEEHSIVTDKVDLELVSDLQLMQPEKVEDTASRSSSGSSTPTTICTNFISFNETDEYRRLERESKQLMFLYRKHQWLRVTGFIKNLDSFVGIRDNRILEFFDSGTPGPRDYITGKLPVYYASRHSKESPRF